MKEAISNSNSYHGVQRKPVNWFVINDAGKYLQALRSRNMAAKVRIFLINDDEVDTMKTQLADPELMGWYWENTGQDVHTYWICESDFRSYWHGIPAIDDFALYDRRLLIVYDEATQVLSFDLIAEGETHTSVFSKLEDQIRSGQSEPFRQILPPHLHQER